MTKTNSKTLGACLEMLRKTEGLSLEQMAAGLGCSEDFLYDIERDHETLTSKQAAEWARALGFNEEQFVRLAGDLEHNK